MGKSIAKHLSNGGTAETCFKPGANATDKARIAEMHAAGKSVQEIADYTRVHPDVVCRILEAT